MGRTKLLLLAAILTVQLAPARSAEAADPARVVRKLLKKTPLIDGHNDLPWGVRARVHGHFSKLDVSGDTTAIEKPMHTDIPRMRRGKVGGQFWSVWIPTSLEGPEAVQTTLEQIDLVHRMCARYPKVFELARTAADVRRIHRAGRIASLIGIEGGHSIGGSLPMLRMMYEAGARYMTLTHWKTIEWADAATDEPRHDGLTSFGEEVVREMNRLGMLVDLSHVSAATMRDALRISEAPVIFSHSGAAAINPHPRNVPDDVLAEVGKKGGVVMVDFLPAYVAKDVWEHSARARGEHKRLEAMHLGDPTGLEAAWATWKEANPGPRSTLAQVADHIDHVRKVAGSAALGIGSDYDGMGDAPDGLEDVSTYPALLEELLRRGYTNNEVRGVAGENILRVMEKAEAVARRLQARRQPSEAVLEAPQDVSR